MFSHTDLYIYWLGNITILVNKDSSEGINLINDLPPVKTGVVPNNAFIEEY